MVITIIILSILLSVSIFVNINLTKKYEELETMSEESVDTLLENEKFLTELKNRIMSQRSYLRQLDRIGAFEADDETGYFFKEMKEIVNDIVIYFGETPLDDQRSSVLEKQKFDAKFENQQKDYYL